MDHARNADVLRRLAANDVEFIVVGMMAGVLRGVSLFERFDSPDDEQDGKWSFNFATSPRGEVDAALLSLDEAEVRFTRRIAAELLAASTLRTYAGTYETATGARFEVLLKEDGTLGIVFPGQPFQALTPWRPRRFRVKEFSDVSFEFVVVDGRVTELKQTDPSGEHRFVRR